MIQKVLRIWPNIKSIKKIKTTATVICVFWFYVVFQQDSKLKEKNIQLIF